MGEKKKALLCCIMVISSYHHLAPVLSPVFRNMSCMCVHTEFLPYLVNDYVMFSEVRGLVMFVNLSETW